LLLLLLSLLAEGVGMAVMATEGGDERLVYEGR
jgi:hypothetical protein